MLRGIAGASDTRVDKPHPAQQDRQLVPRNTQHALRPLLMTRGQPKRQLPLVLRMVKRKATTPTNGRRLLDGNRVSKIEVAASLLTDS
ncbi:hypothetical protein KFU94_65890 [Chloroflexi bacterium TSY]|nr:hypothetical protein [Chloroflexi bacterium TSY]